MTPSCMVEGCDAPASLSDTARGKFFSFTAYFCTECYEKALRGEPLQLDMSRVIVEQAQNTAS